MKRLTCEMCGSTDLVKDGGVFVCQVCGTKYSTEEAKKMMIDGVVSVQGTVKIDKSNELNNYLQLSEDAFSDGRFDTAYSIITDALTITPDNPLLLARQGLAILGKDGFSKDIPLSTINGLDRAFEVAKLSLDAESMRTFVVKLKSDISIACRAVEEKFNEEISDLESQKLPVMSTGESAMMALTFLAGSPTIVDEQKSNQDKQNRKYNEKLDEKIHGVKNRIETLSSFKIKCEDSTHAILLTAQRMINEQYWAEHSDEKKALEAEKEDLESQIKELDAKIADVDVRSRDLSIRRDLEALRSKIREIESQISSLGVFKGKEKKALRLQIEALSKDESVIQDKLLKQENEISDEKAPLWNARKRLKDRISSIEREFKKDR